MWFDISKKMQRKIRRWHWQKNSVRKTLWLTLRLELTPIYNLLADQCVELAVKVWLISLFFTVLPSVLVYCLVSVYLFVLTICFFPSLTWIGWILLQLLWMSGVFRGYKMTKLDRNELDYCSRIAKNIKINGGYWCEMG